MKTFFILLFLLSPLSAEPLLSSWFTQEADKYARIYRDSDDLNSQNAVTTWSRGAGIQQAPVYAGVYAVSYTPDWVYIRTTNMASYVMGPWYTDVARETLAQNYPGNQNAIHRFPRSITDPTTIAQKSYTRLGVTGYMVNGVTIYDGRDGAFYDSATDAELSGGPAEQAWTRVAYPVEGVSFDVGLAHQGGSLHHYHANAPGLRHQLGDSVDFDSSTNTYTESFNGKHSPIIGWMNDGLPLYGPYGYSQPLDPDSGIRRMVTGFQLRPLAVGDARDTWPIWVSRIHDGRASFTSGPDVEATTVGTDDFRTDFFLGRYYEDYDYKGDLGFTQYDSLTSVAFDEAVHFDLNECNVRYCVTPEFPNGTWAYFTCIDENGTPSFPYNIGRTYFGEIVGGAPTAVPAAGDNSGDVVNHFKTDYLDTVGFGVSDVDAAAEELTLSWDPADGGNYRLQYSSDLSSWSDVDTLSSSEDIVTSFIPNEDQGFYRVALDSVAPYDVPEGQTELIQSHYSSVSVTLDSAPSDLDILPSFVSLDGQIVQVVSRPSENEIIIRGDLSALTLDSAYEIKAEFPGYSGVYTGSYFNQKKTKNVMIVIVDDWGVDSSPVDNPTAPNLPLMPYLENMVSTGLHFKNAYALPMCAPTRHTILTGRSAFLTGVGDVGGVNIADEEYTLPEVIADAGLGIQLASFGKWHLGNDLQGPRDAGWPYFIGTEGNIQTSYSDYEQLDVFGDVSDNTVYATTEVTQNAIDWISDKDQEAAPWLCWVAYHGVHSPFEQAPAVVSGESRPARFDTTATAREEYESMLWALDVELNRLIASLDLTETTVIIIGDNGTPGPMIDFPYTSDHAKGTLYDGGTHVPLYVLGAAVEAPGIDESMVISADLFSTALELLGINPSSAGVLLDSKSLVPIFDGSDVEERVAIVEAFSNTFVNPGRALRYEEYKLFIFDDPLIDTDTARVEFYDLSEDPNEESNLLDSGVNPSGLDSTEQAAFDFLLAKNFEKGGAYNYTANPITVSVELDSSDSDIPVRTRTNNLGAVVEVSPREINFIPSGMVTQLVATYVTRQDSGGNPSRYWVECTFDPQLYGLESGTVMDIDVIFAGNTFRALTQFVVP
ncbi:sulfatase-like hydrolase/transferase [Rubritalea sp.]|uniref:sulfatase-like hydrolase/transferase n=1 Tax=Rubritalea sp. TaxID=2109375 RepID=UPI003EF0FB98